MKQFSILFFGVVLVLGQSCTKGNFVSKVDFEVLGSGDYSAITTSNQMEIDSNTEWEDFWVNKLEKDINDMPEVDFETEMVIGLFLGERHTGGYQISADEIDEYEFEVEIKYFETIPKGIVTQAFTYPYQLIKMPTTTKKIVYKKN